MRSGSPDEAQGDDQGAGRGMRRRALHPVGRALDRMTASLAPATLLAEVQQAWPEAAGEAFAAHAEPWAERDGEVSVACPHAVWAQQLDLMSEPVVERLNTALGRPAVRRLRVQARRAPLRGCLLYTSPSPRD